MGSLAVFAERLAEQERGGLQFSGHEAIEIGAVAVLLGTFERVWRWRCSSAPLSARPRRRGSDLVFSPINRNVVRVEVLVSHGRSVACRRRLPSRLLGLIQECSEGGSAKRHSAEVPVRVLVLPVVYHVAERFGYR